MREYIFHGKRIDCDEWAEGYLSYNKVRKQYYIMDDVDSFPIPVHKESVGEYTGMNEWKLIDETRNAPLFEGDIVEVWGWRTVRGRNQSQYDQTVKVRGVIRFMHGEWYIDYANGYNKSLEKLKGAETQEREVSGSHRLYYYGYTGENNIEYRRQRLERDRKFYDNDDEICNLQDIVKIGTEFENKDLLEG